MIGTLTAVLAKRGIKTYKGLFKANVTGDIEDVNGVLKITRIHVSYTLKVPVEKRRAQRKLFIDILNGAPVRRV